MKPEVVEVALLARHELVPPPTGFPDFGDGSDLPVSAAPAKPCEASCFMARNSETHF